MQNNNSSQRYVKIKDLPIYSDENNNNKNVKELYVTFDREKNEFEKAVTAFREFIFDLNDKFAEQKARAIQFYETGVAHTRSSLDYIRSESNILPKATFITVSGLIGYIIAIRRSRFRRLTYSTLLIGASASLCYPNEAKQYSSIAYDWSFKNAKIFYDEYIMPKGPSSSPSELQQAPSSTQKDVILTTAKSDDKPVTNVPGDKGQSSDEDSHMYTTRK